MCPELLGGLPAPRSPSEIRGGDGNDVLSGKATVVNDAGEDVTVPYVEGAKKCLLIALQAGCSSALLKARSPSCGAGTIYDGTFSHTRRPGDGVLAALLREHGMAVRTEEDGPTPSLLPGPCCRPSPP